MNCFWYAIMNYVKHGGYIIVRKSHYGRFPHFLWVKDLKDLDVKHYVPDNPIERKVPPLIFDGIVKTKDD